MDYKNAGVDIEAGYESVELMKKYVKARKNMPWPPANSRTSRTISAAKKLYSATEK